MEHCIRTFNIVIALILLSACEPNINHLQSQSPQFPDHLRVADSLVGKHERKDRAELKEFISLDPVLYEWCAAFVNAVLRKNGISGSESVSENPLMARSFLTYGDPVDEPRLGDIVIFSRGDPWQGHVAFYMATRVIEGKEVIIVLGGNQKDMVSYDSYPSSRVVGIRRLNTQPLTTKYTP